MTMGSPEGPWILAPTRSGRGDRREVDSAEQIGVDVVAEVVVRVSGEEPPLVVVVELAPLGVTPLVDVRAHSDDRADHLPVGRAEERGEPGGGSGGRRRP